MIKYLLALCLLASSAFAVSPISGGASSSVRPNAKIVDAAGGGDYTTIAAAISAGATNISVKSGNYAGGFTVPANTHLKGEPGVVIQAPISNANAVTINGADVTIEDLEIDGRYASQTNNGSQTSQCGIALNAGSDRLRLSRLYIHDTCGDGIASTTNSNDGVIENCRIMNGATAASTVQAAPAPTTTTFAVSPGMAGKFSAGQSIRIGAQTGTISSVQSATSYVAATTSSTVFTVYIGDGAKFANGNVIRVGQFSRTISTVSGDTITLTAPATGSGALYPTPGQIVSIDNITLTGAITTPTAGNVVAITGGYLKGFYSASISRGWTLKHNYFSGWSQAIGLWYGATQFLIEGNTLRDNYGYEDLAHTSNRSAFEVYPNDTLGGRHRVIGNIVDGSTHNCIENAQGEVGTLYQGNHLRYWASEAGLGATGVALEITGQAGFPGATQSTEIISNHIASNGSGTSNGISLNGFNDTTKVASNDLRGFSGDTNSYPIIVSGGSAPLIDGNSFSYCSRDIYVTASAASGGQITHNVSTTSAAYNNAIAINLNISAGGWLVEGNSINQPLCATAFQIDTGGGSKHRVIGNRFIGYFGTLTISTDDNLILGNYSEESQTGQSTQGALYIANGKRNIVRSNTLKGDTTYKRDFKLDGTADYNIVEDNMLVWNFYQDISSGTHNKVEPNHDGVNNITRLLTVKSLGAQTVGTGQATIAHGLGYAPTVVNITMTSAGNIYRSAASDATNIYLTADASNRTADVFVR